MDIKDKLAYYKSNTKEEESNQQTNISPSLKALADAFSGEIFQSAAPYLKISRTIEINPAVITRNNHYFDIDLNFLNRNTRCTTFQMDECVFFDLETTGLMGGTGTFAFLLGFATVAGNRIKVDQYFLPDFGREYYLFKELNTFFQPYKNLISYNGKSYDFPLLKSRYIMNQLEPAFTKMDHHDLLHLSRRVWKDALPACDLISIEQNVLHRNREDDIPGWLIPQSYFDFLQTGVIHNIMQIIEHNYYDLISLVELTLVLNRISNHPEDEKNVNVLARLADLAFRQNDLKQYDRICQAIEACVGRINSELLIAKSVLHKRRRDWPEAVRIWESLSGSGEHAFFALEELAKYHEHQQKDYHLALEYTNRAIKAVDLFAQLDRYQPGHEEIYQKFLKRRNRLEAKLA